MDPNALRFVPTWDQVGDADDPGLAIAYGIVAMATVWLFESIVALLLYDTGVHISLSQVAALVCHTGSSWRDLLKWQVRSRGKRANMRSYIAIVLRLLVTVIDICIIILAVPRTISVTEQDVGMSQINLSTIGAQLLPGRRFSGAPPNPCIWERVRFEGFTPTCALLVCTNAQDDTVPRSSATTNTTGFTLRYNTQLQRLEFRTTPDNRPFYLTHNLFIAASDDLSAPRTFNLPMPPDIEDQVAEAILSNTRCVGRRMRFTCPRLSTPLRTQILGAVLENLYTSAIKRDIPTQKVRVNAGNSNVTTFTDLGSVNRPHLCIFPALILLASLGVVYLGLKISMSGSSDGSGIEVKLFNLVAEATNAKVDENPLVDTDKVLRLRLNDKNADDGGHYLSRGNTEESENDAYRRGDGRN